MRAIRVKEFGGPKVLKLDELPNPKPGPGQVVVRAKAIGVNPVDTYIRAGTYGPGVQPPYVPGSDASGAVHSVGKGVTKVKAGDRVYTSGTTSPGFTGAYAELVVCREDQVHLLPSRVTFQQGAAMNVPYVTAYRALFHRAIAIEGETVLVHGASGGVGIGAVQLARSRGLRVIGTAGTERGRKLVLDQGAHHVLNHRSSDYLDKLRKITDTRGVDIVVEMLANVNLMKDLSVLSTGGRIVVVGSRGTVEFDPRETMMREASVLGMALVNAGEEELAAIHVALRAGLETGALKPVVGLRIPLKSAARAHDKVLEAGSHGKIILIP